jgi:hypothetical protein
MTIIKKKRVRIKNRDKSRDYVNGPTLQKYLEDWYASGSDKIPDKLTLAVLQIIDRLATRGNFSGYSYIDEMVDEARESVTAALIFKKYDVERGNPFAYFTQVAWNAFLAVLNKEHKESYIKHKSLEHHFQELMIAGEELTDVGVVDSLNQDLIEKFETKNNNKKKLKKNDTEEVLEKFLSMEN